MPDVFAELAMDFARLNCILFASHVTASSPSFDVNMARSAPWRLHATCSQEVEGGWCRPVERPQPYGHWWLYNLHVPSHDDECLSACTTPCASTTFRTLVIFYREGLLRSLSIVVAVPYRHNLVNRLWTPIICQLSRGICWLVPGVCEGLPLVTLSAYCA